MYTDDRRFTREHIISLAVNYNQAHPHPHGPLGYAKEWEAWVTDTVEGDEDRPQPLSDFATLRAHLPA